MKNGILLVLLAVLLTLSMGLVGCGGEQAPEITEYDLTISSTEGGSVTTPGEGILTYAEGTVVNLVAQADEGYRFVNWTGDTNTVADANDATTTVTMDDHYSITADFAYGPAIPLKNPDSFVQMTIADADSLDPAWGFDPASCEQVQYIYETLLFFDGEKADQFTPALATEWEVLGDNVTYRFKIREGVKFHEGGDLTPEDVEYSLERAMVQDRHYSYLGGQSWGPSWVFYRPLLGLYGSRDADDNIQVAFDQIDNAIEVEGDWVVFHLLDASWGLVLLQILSSPWASIVDEEWCVANGEWDGTKGTWQDYNNPGKADTYLYTHTNGTGPWKLEEWDPGSQIKLVRFSDYWRESAWFEMVITEVTEEWTSRKDALLAGDVDLVYVQPADIGQLDGIQDLNVYQDLPELIVQGFFFNMDIASNSSYIGSGALDGNGIPTDFFTDLDVRKGCCYAFDYDTFIEDGWLGEAQQLGSPVCEGLPYFNPNASMYSFDLAKAEEHLKLAWDGELWEKGFNFTLVYNPNHLQRKMACEILAENLAAVNPKFQVSTLPASFNNLQMIGGRTMPMFQIGWAADYPHPDNFVVPFMASYGLFAEWQEYGYAELDELIKEAFEELDLAVQQDMYYALQEHYYDDAPTVVLVQPTARRYFTKYIGGFYYTPFTSPLPLYYMSKSES